MSVLYLPARKSPYRLGSRSENLTHLLLLTMNPLRKKSKHSFFSFIGAMSCSGGGISIVPNALFLVGGPNSTARVTTYTSANSTPRLYTPSPSKSFVASTTLSFSRASSIPSTPTLSPSFQSNQTLLFSPRIKIIIGSTTPSGLIIFMILGIFLWRRYRASRRTPTIHKNLSASDDSPPLSSSRNPSYMEINAGTN